MKWLTLLEIKPNGPVSASKHILNPVRTPGFHSRVFPSFPILVFHLFIHSCSIFSTLWYLFYHDTEVYVILTYIVPHLLIIL